MNVASKELCQELYELSDWEPTLGWMKLGKHLGTDERWVINARDLSDFPAYTLGYLLRKLPEAQLQGFKTGGWSIQNGMYGNSYVADTPEDAACKLAIELWKQGILK